MPTVKSAHPCSAATQFESTPWRACYYPLQLQGSWRCSTTQSFVDEANKEFESFFGTSLGASALDSGHVRPPQPSPVSSSGRAAPDIDVFDEQFGIPSSQAGFTSQSAAAGPGPGSQPGMTIAQQQQQQQYHAHAQAQAQAHASAGASSVGGQRLTHVDERGKAAMVDVSQKSKVPRVAQASAVVRLGPVAFAAVQSNSVAKGDVLTVAQLAGIMAAKQTANLIPLCHSLSLSKVDVSLTLDAGAHAVRVRGLAKTVDGTGVEMEALTAVSLASLTVYDMCKALAKDIMIGDIQLDYKSGGKSGTYARPGLHDDDLL